ncbi:MAG: O-antigen ligase family protein [bacterium]|nr:O-antigen ligase family protein [bacterium]
MNRTKAVSFLRGMSLVGIYGGLLMPLMFIPIVIFPFVFSKLIFFQVLIGLTFPAYLLLMWMEPAYRPRFNLLYGAIAAYFVAMALSVIFSVDPFRSWWGNQERMNGLFTLLHFFAWLTMALGVLKTWPQWRSLLHYQIGLSAFMAIVAMLQRVIPNLLLFPASVRVGGLLDNPIYMAAYQIFNLFFLFLLFLKVPSRTARILYGCVAFVDLIAFFLAQSRGALVGLAAGILAFGIWTALFSKNKKARTVTLLSIAGIFLAYSLLFSARNTVLIQHSPFARLTNITASVDTRFIAWKIAWRGFLERPITGYGLDTFHIIFNKHYNPRSLAFSTYETWFDRAHNTVLDVLSMTGLLGFLTFAGIFLSLFYVSWRAYKRGWIDLPLSAIFFGLTVGYFIQNLFVFDHPAAFSMSFLLFGFIIAATSGEFVDVKEKEHVTASKTHAFSWALAVLVFIPFLLLVWRASVLPFQASRYAIKSNGNFPAATGMMWAKKAAGIWTPYLDEQTFLLSRNLMQYASAGQLARLSNWQEYYTLVKELTEKELARHPENTHPHFVYAQLMTLFYGQKPEAAKIAEEQYRLAIQTSPKRQQLFLGLASLYAREGRGAEMMEAYRRARDFDLEIGEMRWVYGVALFYDAGNLQEGAKEILASQTVNYPRRLATVQELSGLMDAATVAKDQAMLALIPKQLAALPAGTMQEYAQIANRYAALGMVAERDEVLRIGEQMAPGTQAVFDQAKSGIQQVPAAQGTTTKEPTESAKSVLRR